MSIARGNPSRVQRSRKLRKGLGDSVKNRTYVLLAITTRLAASATSVADPLLDLIDVAFEQIEAILFFRQIRFQVVFPFDVGRIAFALFIVAVIEVPVVLGLDLNRVRTSPWIGRRILIRRLKAARLESLEGRNQLRLGLVGSATKRRNRHGEDQNSGGREVANHCEISQRKLERVLWAKNAL